MSWLHLSNPCAFFTTIAHGAAGAVGARLSLRPLPRGSNATAQPGRKPAAGTRSRASIFILHCGKKLAHSTPAGQPLEYSPMSLQVSSPQTMPSETDVRAKRAEEAYALEEDTR